MENPICEVTDRISDCLDEYFEPDVAVWAPQRFECSTRRETDWDHSENRWSSVVAEKCRRKVSVSSVGEKHRRMPASGASRSKSCRIRSYNGLEAAADRSCDEQKRFSSLMWT